MQNECSKCQISILVLTAEPYRLVCVGEMLQCKHNIQWDFSEMKMNLCSVLLSKLRLPQLHLELWLNNTANFYHFEIVIIHYITLFYADRNQSIVVNEPKKLGPTRPQPDLSSPNLIQTQSYQPV